MRANTLARSEQSNTLSIVRSHTVAAPAYQDALVMRAGPTDIAAAVARFSAERFIQLREILTSITRADAAYAADGCSDGVAGTVAQVAARRVADGITEGAGYLPLLKDGCEIDAIDYLDLAVRRFSSIRALLDAVRLEGGRGIADLAAAGLVLATSGLERAQAGRLAVSGEEVAQGLLVSVSAVLNRARALGVVLRVDHDQLNVSGPLRLVGALLHEIADVESEIVAALQLVAGTGPAGAQVAGPQEEILLRAELVALIGEVSVLLGETSRPAAVQAHALREPLHAIPASLAFFRDCASSLRAAQAARAFIGSLLRCPLGLRIYGAV